jgi:hypothetical protein
MTDVAEFNFPAFNAEAKRLRAEGHEVFNPAELPAGLGYRQYLAMDMAWICAHADEVAVLPDWIKSPGACAEIAVAHALKLKVTFL